MMELHRLQTDEDACFPQYVPSQTEQLPVQVPSQELEAMHEFTNVVTQPHVAVKDVSFPPVDELHHLQADEEAVVSQDLEPGEPLPAQVPSQVLEALHKLIGAAKESQSTRADLMLNEATAQLYPSIPFDDKGNVTSLGSILHAEHLCKPCSFWMKGKCRRDDLCMHCHFEHDILIPETGKRLRKSKKARILLPL
jgi:hypothetical protein